jgi:peptidoglycan hydrolase-like protein with peptidoglycan-binding domain
MIKQLASVLVGIAGSVVFGAAPVWPQTTNPETGQTKMEGTAKRTPEAKKGEEEMEARGAQKPGRMGRSGAARPDAKQNVNERSAAQDVRKVQEALKNQGHDPGGIDGIMGPQTRQAIRSFQTANGLKETGRLDAETADKLNLSGK